MTKQESSCSYRFISSSLTELPATRDYDITIRQQPERAKMSVVNERDKRPIEPPPILQMKWINCSEEETKKCLQSPFYFVVANLLDAENNDQLLTPTQNYLHGTTVSSLYRLRDIDNKDGGFFVFGDLSVKKDGVFKLQFNLFEIIEGDVQTRYTIISNPFTVYLAKRFPGPLEATFLSRTFSDQGVKMRIRKEHRLQTSISRKRKPSEQKPNNDNNKTKKIATESYIKSSSISSSSLSSANEVYFGKFSSNNTSLPISSSSSSSSSSPMLIDHSESSSSLRIHSSPPSSMYKFHHYDTSVYPTPQSSTDLISDIKQLHIQRSSSPVSSSTTSSPLSRPYSMPPSPTYTIHHSYSSSPPSSNLNHSFPSITGNLTNYHLTSSSSSSSSSIPTTTYHYLPPSSLPPPHLPPSSLSSSSSHWGTKLPPLKMIFNENHHHHHHPSFFSKISSSNWQLPPVTTHYSS